MSEAEIISHEPATGVEVWRGRAGDVDDTVARARRAWPGWAAQPLSNRMEAVRRFANEVRKEAENLATLISRETGKPLWESRIEVENVLGRVELSIRAYSERTAQRKYDNALNGTTAVRHKPHGVVAVIGPFSSPAHLACGHIIPALIAGNAVIYKPSERVPGSAEALMQCFTNAGIPTAVAQLLIGGPEHGQALALHEGVCGVLFTGSTDIGITLNRKLAARPDKFIALELGGNNPIVVLDTPLVSDAAVLIVQSAFSSAGQRCTSARRLIVKASIYDALMAQVKALADRLIVGSPFDEPAPFMGPVIDNHAADGLLESFVYLMSNGGRPIKHMVRPDQNRPFLTPAIIDTTGVRDRPDIELYGPLLQVIKVDDLDQGIAEANATRFGLSASLIGGTPQDYSKFWANIRAGVVNWNRPTVGAPMNAPFGGTGLSGNHRPTGYYAADYCAYPVTSAELEQPRATVGVGFKDA